MTKTQAKKNNDFNKLLYKKFGTTIDIATKQDVYKMYKNNTYWYWFLEELKGISPNDTSHRLKNSTYYNNQRIVYEWWKKNSMNVKFKNTVYMVIYNLKTPCIEIFPLIGEYVATNKWMLEKQHNYKSLSKTQSDYNVIGFFNSKEEAEIQQTKLNDKLLQDINFKKYTEYVLKIKWNEVAFKTSFSYTKSHINANEWRIKAQFLNSISNETITTQMLDSIESNYDKIEKENSFNGDKELYNLRQEYETNTNKLITLKNEALELFKQNGEIYFKNIKIIAPTQQYNDCFKS